MKRLLLLVLSMIILGGSDLPYGAIRRDGQFWNMLTPAARQTLQDVPVLSRPECLGAIGEAFVGAVYDSTANSITICGEPEENPDRLRHEALHALDWSAGIRSSDTINWRRDLPSNLYIQAQEAYLCAGDGCGGIFTPAEIWPMLPIVAEWDFDQLPPEISARYAPWFVDASQ